MKKRADPTSLSDDDLVERWNSWLEHTKREAHEFYSFRFKFENVSKMFGENTAFKPKAAARRLIGWSLTEVGVSGKDFDRIPGAMCPRLGSNLTNQMRSNECARLVKVVGDFVRDLRVLRGLRG